MLSRGWLALGACIWLWTSPVQAEPASNASGAGLPTQPNASQPRQGRPRMHCVRETPTGSFIAERTCYTEEEWRERQRLAQENQRQILDRHAACARGGGGTAC